MNKKTFKDYISGLTKKTNGAHSAVYNEALYDVLDGISQASLELSSLLKERVDTKGKNQYQIILDHFQKYGKISSFEAIVKYRITRLPVSVHLIRKRYGKQIITNKYKRSVEGKSFVIFNYNHQKLKK